MTGLFFGYLAAAIVFLSILSITRRNPVHSVILMLLMFFHVAALYIFLNAEFMAAIQIIVYAGAILVLFLFVVLLLNLKNEVRKEKFVGTWVLGLALAVGLSFVIFMAIGSYVSGPKGIYTDEALEGLTHTAALGTLMYTEYIFPFEIASLILLVAVIGAIVIAKRRLKS